MAKRWIGAAASAIALVFVALNARATGDAIDTAAAAAEPQAVAIQMDVAHTGVTSTAALFRFPLAEYWRLDFPGPVSYPLIANGRVFVTVADAASYGSMLFALDVKSGKTLWKTPISGTYYWSAAAYDAGRVYVLNFDGLLKAFDAATGAQQWSVQVANEYFVTSPPVAQAGVVYVQGDGSDSLSAYEGSTGALIWTREILAGEAAPTIGGGGVYVSSPCQVYAFNPASGKPLWNFSGGCEGGGGFAPVYANGDLYVSDPFGSGNQIFNARTGVVVGSYDSFGGPPVVGAQHAYLVTSGMLQAQSLQTKGVMWTFVGDGGISQLPIKVNETVFVGSSSGLLWGLDGDTGKRQWSTNVGNAIVPNGCCTGPDTGLAESDGFLIVPASTTLVAYHTSLASTKGKAVLNLYRGTAPPITPTFNPQDNTSFNDSTTTTVCDLRGASYPISFYFAATAQPGVWDVYATIGGVVVSANPTTMTLTFGSTGQLEAPKNGNLNFTYSPANGGAPLAVAFDFSETTSYDAAFGVTSITANGCK
jgi:outer membrane protein assembly factor BamB